MYTHTILPSHNSFLSTIKKLYNAIENTWEKDLDACILYTSELSKPGRRRGDREKKIGKLIGKVIVADINVKLRTKVC